MENAVIISLYFLNISAGLLFATHFSANKIGDYLGVSRNKKISALKELVGRKYEKILNIDKRYINDYIILSVVFIIIGVIAGIYAGIMKGALVASSGAVFILIRKNIQENEIGEIFKKNAYKLYRYLVSQIQAGVKPKDVITNMYKVTEDKKLYDILAEASGTYSITLDGRSYAECLKKHIKTTDCEHFAMILEEDLLYSKNDMLLSRMEEMMFNRYFSYQQKKTDSIKRRCLASVCIFVLIIMIMISIPLIADLKEALKNIFI
jgi:hypothetical protein